MAISCIGIGWALSTKAPTPTKVGQLVIAFLVGCPGWEFIGLILAAFHAFTPIVIRILVYIAGFASLAIYGTNWWTTFRRFWSFDWKWLALAVPILAEFLYCLMPVTSFDSTYYHLPLSQYMLDKGTILWTPYIINSAFPQTYELLSAINLAIGRDAGACLLSFWLGLATILALVEIGNKVGKPGIATWAAVVAGIVPLWFNISSVPNAEIGLAFGIMILALAIVASWPAWVVGAAVGWLAGCKYTGIEVAIIALVIWTWQTRAGWRGASAAVGIAALISGFWYIRNIYLFSDPLFPYFTNAFSFLGPLRAPAAADSKWDAYSMMKGFSSPTTLSGWITAPFRALVSPEHTFTKAATPAWQGAGWLTLAWPFAIFTIVKNKSRLFGVFMLVLLAVLNWLLIHHLLYLRFLTPYLPLMLTFSLLALSDWLAFLRLSAQRVKMIEMAASFLIIVVIVGVQYVGPVAWQGLTKLPLTRSQLDSFLARSIKGYYFIQQLNKMEPAPVVYYLYGENTRHFCRFQLYSDWKDPIGFDQTSESRDIRRRSRRLAEQHRYGNFYD